MNTLGEWPLDNFDDVKTAGVVDDEDVSKFEDAFEKYGLLRTYLQIHRRTPKVGNLQEKVANAAGIGQKKTMAKAIAKKLVEIGRDIEATWLSDNQAQEGMGTTPYKTRGLLRWTDQEQSVLPIPKQFRTPEDAVFNAALSTLTEDSFSDMMQARWDEVGEAQDFTFATGSTLRKHISKWSTYAPEEADLTTIRRFNSNKSDTVTRKISVIETEFGTLKLRNSSFINLSGDPKSTLSRMQGIAFDAANIQGRWAEAPSFTELPNLGGGKRGLIESISQLRPANPKDLLRVNPTGA